MKRRSSSSNKPWLVLRHRASLTKQNPTFLSSKLLGRDTRAITTGQIGGNGDTPGNGDGATSGGSSGEGGAAGENELDAPPCSKDCDGDGFQIEEGDCDDNDPEVAPGFQEICDNKNNDCDAKVDENLFTECYTGKGHTLDVGVCHAGERTCFEGDWGPCLNQVTPSPDICGSNFAENCNGE